MDVNDAWDFLIDSGIVTEETLKVVTNINGYSLETLEDVLYSETGYHSFEQYGAEVTEEIYA